MERSSLADRSFDLACSAFGGVPFVADSARVMAERMAAAADRAEIVILDIPLLSIATKERFTFSAIVVVDTPEDLAVARLVGQRGFTEEDARARMAAQISREERKALADVVIDNSGDRAALEAEMDRAWAWLRARAAG